MIPDSEEQKKLMQERLEYFRARLKTLTDSDFDAIMIRLGLSTARTPPNPTQTDDPTDTPTQTSEPKQHTQTPKHPNESTD